VLRALIDEDRIRDSTLRFGVLPRLGAFGMFAFTSMMDRMRPSRSYYLNADIEDHAQHEYASLVSEHPEWDTVLYDGNAVPRTEPTNHAPTCCGRLGSTSESTSSSAAIACRAPSRSCYQHAENCRARAPAPNFCASARLRGPQTNKGWRMRCSRASVEQPGGRRRGYRRAEIWMARDWQFWDAGLLGQTDGQAEVLAGQLRRRQPGWVLSSRLADRSRLVGLTTLLSAKTLRNRSLGMPWCRVVTMPSALGLCDRGLVRWSMGERQTTDLVVDGLVMALSYLAATE
jgi:hypothetical protein